MSMAVSEAVRAVGGRPILFKRYRKIKARAVWLLSARAYCAPHGPLRA